MWQNTLYIAHGQCSKNNTFFFVMDILLMDGEREGMKLLELGPA